MVIQETFGRECAGSGDPRTARQQPVQQYQGLEKLLLPDV